MPGLTRSDQPLTCFGLPGRSAKTTTESAPIPRYDCLSQFASTSPASTSMFTSAPVERKRTSAGRPAVTARAWSVEPANDCVKETACPSGVCCQAWMILPITVLGVEYATSERLTPLPDAPATVAALKATAPTAKANEIRLIVIPYLSTFSTD